MVKVAEFVVVLIVAIVAVTVVLNIKLLNVMYFCILLSFTLIRQY